jgi:hypothetical protein
MAAWRPRVLRLENGKLRFVFARYRPEEPRQRCGLASLDTFALGAFGSDLDELRHFARSLLAACDEPIIPPTEYELEAGDDEDDEDDEEDDEP